MSVLCLGIETSCDETAASVVRDGRVVLSNVVSSSVKLHRRYGGVVPEIACRHHVSYILPVVRKALEQADADLSQIDAFAVTEGPGLVGALLVGISMAKSLAVATGRPLIGVNHLAAHLWAGMLCERRPALPCVGLVLSGGHSSLAVFRAPDRFEVLGQTLDDAAGEAFDKVGKLLGLPFPGGPEIERLARAGSARGVDLPWLLSSDKGLDFSFSGVKTAVKYAVQGVPQSAAPPSRVRSADMAARFQEVIVELVVRKTLLACEKAGADDVVVGGGVACNRALRTVLTEEGKRRGIRVHFPTPSLCADNGAMIAGLGGELFQNGRRSNLRLTANPSLRL